MKSRRYKSVVIVIGLMILIIAGGVIAAGIGPGEVPERPGRGQGLRQGFRRGAQFRELRAPIDQETIQVPGPAGPQPRQDLGRGPAAGRGIGPVARQRLNQRNNLRRGLRRGPAGRPGINVDIYYDSDVRINLHPRQGRGPAMNREINPNARQGFGFRRGFRQRQGNIPTERPEIDTETDQPVLRPGLRRGMGRGPAGRAGIAPETEQVPGPRRGLRQGQRRGAGNRQFLSEADPNIDN